MSIRRRFPIEPVTALVGNAFSGRYRTTGSGQQGIFTGTGEDLVARAIHVELVVCIREEDPAR